MTAARGKRLHRNVGKGALRGSGGGSEGRQLDAARPQSLQSSMMRIPMERHAPYIKTHLAHFPRHLVLHAHRPRLSTTVVDSKAAQLDFKFTVTERRNEECLDPFKMQPHHCQRERKLRRYLRRRNNLIRFGWEVRMSFFLWRHEGAEMRLGMERCCGDHCCIHNTVRLETLAFIIV